MLSVSTAILPFSPSYLSSYLFAKILAMLSNYPAMLPTDGQLPAIWDCPEFFSTMTLSPTPVVSSPTFNEVDMNSTQVSPNSYEPKNPVDQNPNSLELDQTSNLSHQITNSKKRTRIDAGSNDRKMRRMISNRESAKRSRMRKQKHVENLTNQLNRLRMENRILLSRLRFILHQCHQVKMDNERMRMEHVVLSQRLAEIRQVTIRQTQEQFASVSSWPCSNNNAYIASEHIPSIIMY